MKKKLTNSLLSVSLKKENMKQIKGGFLAGIELSGPKSTLKKTQ